jgi:glucokinase
MASAQQPGASDRRPIALAIDIGGTKMAAGLVDADGALLVSERAPTPAQGGGDEMFDALAAMVARVLDDGTARGLDPAAVCGVGCGGPMSWQGEDVSPVNIPAWRRFPLRRRLHDATGLDVFVDNDAKAMALAEGWRGAARGTPDYLGMVVSTGVGGGIISRGRLVDGAQGNAGHIGHIVVEPDGHRCGCGGQGCLEAEASGTAIERITGRPAKEAGPDVIERTGTMVGRAVASVANLLDLRLAVVAGSVALGFGEPFFAAAQRELEARAQLDFARGAVIRPAGLGADSPLVGAAAVGWRGLGHDIGIR